MSIQLLPADIDELINSAVKVFWKTRSRGSATQGGTRGNVIGGKNLDGFLGVTREVAKHCGVPKSALFVKGKKELTLPGYYRVSKTWDVVIVHRHRLVAVLEFKSQVGSFGNNCNNRTEEAIGSASDLWLAFRKGAYDPTRHMQFKGPDITDPRPPFFGYLMLLEDCDKSTSPVRADSYHYPIFPEFRGASYAERYRILCERLMEQNLYRAASVVMSCRPHGAAQGTSRSLSEATDVRNLFKELAAHLTAAFH